MSDWETFTNKKPEQDQPCYYKIIVTCRGWYRPDGDDPLFAPDDRHPPEASFITWTPWEEGETFNDVIPLMRKFREEKAKEAEDAQQDS